MKAFWNAYKVPLIIAGVVVGLALIAIYQWGYINGKKDCK